MNMLKMILLLSALPLLCSCSSGGGGGGGSAGGGGGGDLPPGPPPTVEYKMTDVTPPANTGTVGGFVYSTQQAVDVNIAVPYPNGVVAIYESRPVVSIYDVSGNLLNTPTVTEPPLLTQGIASVLVGDMYHYRETIMMPVAATTVYLATPARIDVPIVQGKVNYTFSAGGSR